MKKDFLISTIMPVYNVEKYLDKAIKSVIKQSIGFKNIELILVNDGSQDNSDAICQKYQKKYPDNVIYISKKNEGVSIARNTGLKEARGKYVNFLDSDDYIDTDFYKKAYDMLESHDEIDFVACRLKYFEASTDYHYLDYKFTGDRIIDILEEPQSILLHINCTLIRKDIVEKIKFDSKLKISEDTKLIYEILLNKSKYGILSSSIYHYRRRVDETSAVQNSRLNKSWYFDTIENCHEYLIKKYKEKYSEVIPYLQHFLMYDIQWRMKAELLPTLTDSEVKKYKNSILEMIKLIDDDVILFQENTSVAFKQVLFDLKYKGKYKNNKELREDGVYFNNQNVFSFKKLENFVEISYVKEGKLHVEGCLNLNGYDLYYKVNNNRYKVNTYIRKPDFNLFQSESKIIKDGYEIDIPLAGAKSITFEIKAGNYYYPLTNEFIHFSHIPNYKLGYYYKEKYLLFKKGKKIIVQYKPLRLKVFFKEILFLAYILLFKKQVKSFVIRLLYYITKPFMPKNIWLFADREFMARDSAELLFKYTNKMPQRKKRSTYFVVEEKSEDFKRMQEFGKVLDYHSLKYKLFFLNARYIISSHADGYVNNEFGTARKFYCDIYKFEYIYLTHGILLHDSSDWLNRINKDITLNVVTSPMEYKSLIDGYYYFKPEQLMKTGLPRHDNLMTKDVFVENKILIMASWRSSLVGPAIKGTQKRKYNPNFTKSEYFRFYDKLFNDKKLQKVLEEYNYKIKFCIHPSFRAQQKDFKGNEFVEIAIDVDSQYETKSSKMLITDYSSAACDFAYLRKPVIYANFDLDHIYEIHYYNKGYFDYDINGFGPNCKSYDETIKEIIKCIKNNCKMESKYIKRCNDFFYFKDDKNTKRVYDALVEHDMKRK